MNCKTGRAVRRRLHSNALAVGIVTAASMAMTGMAAAADLADDLLRGSLLPSFETQSYNDWTGVNVGVYYGWSNQSSDFGSGSSDLIAHYLRNTVIENEARVSQWTSAGRATGNASGYGAFLGYSYEMAPRLIAGVDVTYTRFSSSVGAGFSDYMARSYVTSDQFDYTVDLRTDAKISVKDYATLRGRLGYAFGQFLPYVIVGGAVARVDVSRSAQIGVGATYVGGAPILADIPFRRETVSDNRSTFAYGLVAGAGIDAMIMPNMFVRAEYEFVQFAPIDGIKANLQTGRVGLGMRF
jgi:opacity protein-like surface antigen